MCFNPTGAMLTLETISLDSISEEQGGYIRRISPSRSRYEMLLVRGMETCYIPRKPVLFNLIWSSCHFTFKELFSLV